MYFISNLKHLLLLSGDIEANLALKHSSNIKFCYCNLSGLAAHDFIKVPLVEVFIKRNNLDIVCLLQTFLDSTIPNNDVIVQINKWRMFRNKTYYAWKYPNFSE